MDVRRRFWVESLLAAAATLLAVVTAAWPDWIELVLGADPDGGNGALEWLVVALAAALAVGFAALARAERRAHG